MSATAQFDQRISRDPAPQVVWLCRMIAAIGTGATIGVVATAVMWSSSSAPPKEPGASRPTDFQMASTALSRAAHGSGGPGVS
jgi:hypothetical protein